MGVCVIIGQFWDESTRRRTGRDGRDLPVTPKVPLSLGVDMMFLRVMFSDMMFLRVMFSDMMFLRVMSVMFRCKGGNGRGWLYIVLGCPTAPPPVSRPQ